MPSVKESFHTRFRGVSCHADDLCWPLRKRRGRNDARPRNTQHAICQRCVYVLDLDESSQHTYYRALHVLKCLSKGHTSRPIGTVIVRSNLPYFISFIGYTTKVGSVLARNGGGRRSPEIVSRPSLVKWTPISSFLRPGSSNVAVTKRD